MSDLKTQAEELGIKVDKRWGEARIQSEIDKALEAPAKLEPFGGKGDHDDNGKTGGAVKTALVYLDYDTWINDERIRADPAKAIHLPLGRAKELLAEGKARRADPLPGDE